MNVFKEMSFDGHRNVLVDAIDELTKDNEYISEVQTNGPGLLFYKERGQPKRMKLPLNTEAEYAEAIDGLITKAGLIKRNFVVEGRYTLSGGRFGRLHIIMPPATPFPLVTLALKTDTLTNLTAIQSSGAFNTDISIFLKAAVASKLTVVVSGGTGAGKALHKDVKIPTPFGLKTVNDINVGDIIYDERGNETEVLKKYCPKDPKSYEVEFDSGEKVRTSAGHLWSTTLLKEGESTGESVDVISTEDMYNYGVKNNHGQPNFAIESLSGPVKYSEKELPIDPYSLGVWLGDEEVANEMNAETHEEIPASHDLLNEKHIPVNYRLSSVNQRKSLMAGLIDTSCSVDKSGLLNFENVNKKVVEGAREIAASLGWKPTKITSSSSASKDSYAEKKDNKIESEKTHSFSFNCEGVDLHVKLKRDMLDKLNEQKNQQSLNSRHHFVNITEVEDNPNDYYCFQVDSPNKLFLCTEDFIPTHNTTLLEALTKEFLDYERIGVAEDSPELELDGPNTAYMNSTVWSPGMNVNDVASLTWVVQQLNRMRIDRIMIGETRGKEFFDFVVAANSGKPGSLTTIHANSGPAAMKKMSTFMYMAVDMSPRIIGEMIAEAIDIVIQLGHNDITGEHKVISIHEVTNAISSGDSPTIALNPLFMYNHDSDTWDKRYATDNLKRDLEKHGFDPNNYSPAIADDIEEFSGGLPSYFKRD